MQSLVLEPACKRCKCNFPVMSHEDLSLQSEGLNVFSKGMPSTLNGCQQHNRMCMSCAGAKVRPSQGLPSL